MKRSASCISSQNIITIYALHHFQLKNSNIADVGVNLSRYLMLVSREVIFEVFQPM